MVINGPVTVKKPDGSTDTSSLIDNGWVGGTDNVAGENVTAQADKAKLTIKNGAFEGKSGSASCSVVKNDDYGVLEITGGKFDSTNNAGNSNATTILNWNVATISGGTFIGSYPISNGSYSNEADQGKLTISGGNFTGTSSLLGQGQGGTSGAGKLIITDGNFNASQFGVVNYAVEISGGLFSSDPSAYVAADHYVDASNNGDYPYTVKAGTKTDAPVIVKDATTVTVPDDAGLTDAYKNAIKEKSSVDGVAEAIADNKAALIPEGVDTTSAKKVEIDVSVGVNVTEADLTAGTMTFEAKPVATVTTTKADGTQDKKENVAVPNSLLNGEITVKLPLPEGFTLKQIKHISSDGSVEYFLDTPKTGAKTFKIDETNNCVILKITHFSKFELSTKSDYVEPVYTSAPITKKDVKFDDVDVNAYYAPAVKWAVENKITAGKTDKLFAPDDTCTRGEMITFLWNAAGKPAAKNTTNPFTDVNAGAFYYDAVLWAVSNGITSGTSETTFSPDNTVSRAQVVAFLYNYANKPAAANSTFSDVAADAYYAPAVGWAAAQKITSGTGNNTFSPENDCTRAQIVTFLYNDLAK
ncbi:MAG: S-layer homology domain-containing protein [Oscillospiraceae bacterium]|nr:S-layer homology domain-containing protein [Oscillospiraceae bacterium]